MTPQQIYGRAIALHQDGRLGEAERLYGEVLAAVPGNFSARHMLGVIQAQQGRHEEALEAIGAALAIRPSAADALVNYANVLSALGRHREALARYDQALEIAPGDADAWSNRGNALGRLGRHPEALANFDRALTLRPDHRDAHFGRGAVLQGLGRDEEALADYDRTLALDPDHVDALNNRAVLLWNLGRNNEALAACDRVLALAPALAPAWSNRGNVLRGLGRMQEALGSYNRAIAAEPTYAEAYQNKGFCLLAMGSFAEGWRLHEWRKLLHRPIEARFYHQPLWTGAEDIAGKTLFVYVEQGLGDTIQFFRFLPPVLARGARVVLSAQERLTRLLAGAGLDIRFGDQPAEFDYHIPLMSLPLALGTTIETIPATVPYLQAEPERVRHWAARVGGAGYKVGFCWQGAPRTGMDFGRSILLAQFADLAKIPGLRLISLQKNNGSEQLDALPTGMKVERLDDFDDGPDAFIDTAAVMENLDLVITVDTSLAHLAGALGQPTWLALKSAPDWRWFLDRTDSPWYPTMRLFRQNGADGWDGEIAAMARELIQEMK